MIERAGLCKTKCYEGQGHIIRLRDGYIPVPTVAIRGVEPRGPCPLVKMSHKKMATKGGCIEFLAPLPFTRSLDPLLPKDYSVFQIGRTTNSCDSWTTLDDFLINFFRIFRISWKKLDLHQVSFARLIHINLSSSSAGYFEFTEDWYDPTAALSLY